MSKARPRVLIVGGGPGGMAAAIWAHRLGLEAELLEGGHALGGQLLSVLSPVTDYPGIQNVDGPALAARFVEHVRSIDVGITLGCTIVDIEPAEPALTTGAGDTLSADAIVVATGSRRRRLGLADEQRLAGRGVSYSVSKDRARAAGSPVVIVGGGDSAVEGATSLADVCPEVHLVFRDGLVARPDFVDAAKRKTNLHFYAGREVHSLAGDERLEAVRLDDGTELDCSMLFVRIGVEPTTAPFRNKLPCDERGFLQVDGHQRCAGKTYAVGDVCSPRTMAVAVAVGQAMIACKHIQSSWRR